MRKLFLSFFLFTMGFASTISWHEEYDEAAKLAKEKKKAMVLLFTGGSRCGWCRKIKQEIFEHPDFVEQVKDQFIFYHCDGSKRSSVYLDEQNQELKKRFSIRGYPTVILLSSSEEYITKMGYLPISAKEYAKNLKKTVKSYEKIKTTLLHIEDIENNSINRALFHATKIHSKPLEEAIIQKSLEKKPTQGVLLVYFSNLLKKGKIQEAQAVKQAIIYDDPNFKNETHLEMALLEYQYLYRRLDDSEKIKAVEPLLSYIEKTPRKERLWQLHMMISHFYQELNRPKEALKHARIAFKKAPICLRKSLCQHILLVKKSMAKEKRQ